MKTIVPITVAVWFLAVFAPGASKASDSQAPAGCVRSLEQGKDLLGQRRLREAQEVLRAATRTCPNIAEVFNTLGLAYDFDSQFAEAQKAYRKALVLDPRNIAYRNNLAASYLRSGQSSLGVAEFKKVLEADPGNQTANFNLGSLYLAEKQFRQAVRCFRAAEIERSQDPFSLLQLTEAYYGAGEAQAARQTAARLAQLPNLDPRIRFNLALQLAQLGEYQKAAEQFEAIPPADRDAAAFLNLGMVYSRLRQPEKARQAYQESIRLDPANPDPYLRMGLEASAANTHDAAVDWINQAYTKAPERLDIVSALIRELISIRNYERARDILTAALSRAPSEPSLLEASGDLFSAQRREQDALEAYRKCLSVSPDRASARLSLAGVYLALRQTDAAKAELEKVLQMDPRNAAAKAKLGRMALEAGQLDAALKWVEQALAAEPDNVSANEDKAKIKLRQGNAADALPALERLLKLQPRNPQYHYLMGQVLVKLQRREDAQKEFQLSRQWGEGGDQAPVSSAGGEPR
jgi:Flp pilus assembly protein TadD